MIYQLGMIVTTKKTHVCGNKKWEIIRTGADYKLKCLGCGREIMLSKVDLDKRVIKT